MQAPQPRLLFQATLAAALLLTACDDAGEPLNAPSLSGKQSKRTYDIRSVPSSRLAPRPVRGAVPLSVLPRAAQAPKKVKGRKPAPLANGSFELNGGVGTAELDDWQVVTSGIGFGSWWVQTGDASPVSDLLAEPPTDGRFAAMADQLGPGLHILYQDVVVPKGPAILSFDLYLNNLAGQYFTPGTLSPDEFPNQQFRVDVLDPSAPIDDVGAGVLLPVYHTAEGDPATASYRTISVSLRQFAGRTVRIRFAEVDNQFFFLVGIDRVQLGHKAKAIKDRRERHRGHATAEPIPFAPEPEPTAHRLQLEDDQSIGPLPIGFEFEFFGERYTEFRLSSNGFITFDAGNENTGCCSGGVIPSDDGLNNLIALAWTDLYAPGGGRIAYELRGSGPKRRLVVSFSEMPWFPEIGVPRVTSQLILHEHKDLIEIHTTHQDAGYIYTQGVENADGTVAAALAGRVAASYGLDRDAVRFTTSAR